MANDRTQTLAGRTVVEISGRRNLCRRVLPPFAARAAVVAATAVVVPRVPLYIEWLDCVVETMMTELVGTTLALIGLWFWRRRRLRRRLRPFWLEKTLRLQEPIALVGRPDVVWIDGTGRLVVGDYKDRQGPLVHESERIQLSAYRLLLRHMQKRAVADHGWIHFADGRRSKVALFSERRVVKLYQRYQALLDGRVKPRCCSNDAYCAYCDYRDECH